MGDLTCPACQAATTRLLVPADALPERASVYQCDICATAFFPKRTLEPDYWKATGQEASYADDLTESAFRELHLTALDEIAAAVPVGRLLDVGCGDGLFLRLAAERGWAAEGLDVSERAAELARARSSCAVRVGLAESLPDDAGPWDAITLWDIIEHCPDPRATIAALARHLTPGGVIAIRTPNEDSFFRRFARIVRVLTCGACSSFLKYVYYHPHYVTFTAEGLRRMLCDCGFDTPTVRHEETPLSFARAKIRAAYARYPGHRLLCALLPVAYGAARILGPNKLFVLARHAAERKGEMT